MSESPTQVDPFEQLLRDALAPTYVLVRKLGAGGMGSVYLARDPALKRLVAVKVLAPELADDPGPRSRFQREAEAVASLSHPNVVAVYSVGTLANGVPYFVMQHVNGRSFADRIEANGPLDMDSARRYLGDVASALAAAHKQGIIHRDIKPANILHDDESNRALVTDFGIASVLTAGGSDPAIDAARTDVTTAVMTRLTQTGAMVGTPAYMSPEQLLAEPVTEKTDIYSLGLLGYELLTGQGPYAISSPGEIIAAHIRDAPRPLASVRSDVDPELESMLHACLAKDASQRPAAEELSKRLSRGAHVLLEWPPPALEAVHGQLRGAAVPLGAGALLVGAPLSFLTLEVDNPFRQALPPTATIAAIIVLGLILVLVGGFRTMRLVRGSVSAIVAGHGWLTAAEVAADHRRDGGVLIVGGREYATLLPAQRDALRRRRLRAGLLSLAAAFAPMIGGVAALLIGRLSDVGPAMLLPAVVVLPLVLWAVALNMEARDALGLRGARNRLARLAPTATASDLVTAWKPTFENARRGQRIGSGMHGRPRWLHRIGSALAVAAIVTTAGALGIVAASVAASRRYAGLLAEDRAGSYQVAFDQSRSLEAYRPPIDPAISPLRAGEAWHALAVHWAREEDTKGSSMGSSLRRPARYIEGGGRSSVPSMQVRLAGADGPLFGLANVQGSVRYGVAAALHVASRGFTDRQRAVLADLASASLPAAREFAVLSRAQRTDFWAAALNHPLPKGADLAAESWQLLPDVGLVAEHFVASAALELEAGRAVRAEARLRDLIGIGFALMEDRSPIVALVGHNFAAYGAGALRELYTATRQLDKLRSLADATIASTSDARSFVDVRHATRTHRERALDSMSVARAGPRFGRLTRTAPRVRWTAVLVVLPYLPCLELRHLLFGPDADSKAFWSQARGRIVRDSTDAMLFRFAEGALDHPIPMRPDADLSERLSRYGLRLIDAFVGGHRFEACGARREVVSY